MNTRLSIVVGATILASLAMAREVPASSLFDNPDAPVGTFGIEVGFQGAIDKAVYSQYLPDENRAHLGFISPLNRRTTLLGNFDYHWHNNIGVGDHRVHRTNVATAEVKLRLYLGAPKSPARGRTPYDIR